MDGILGTAILREGNAAGVGTPLSAELAKEATARLFRSVRAGRSWARNREARLDSGPAPACVTLKPGNDGPPLFILPGAPGSIFQLGPLASAIPAPMPVYAIKPRGLDDGAEPCQTIGEMAEYSIGVIRTVRPQGPYLLAGYSAGGLVALEIAQQLTTAGESVPLVLLLDTYPSRQVWPLSCHLQVIGLQTLRRLRSLPKMSSLAALREIVVRAGGLKWYLGLSGVLPPPPVVPEGWSEAQRRVHVATYNAGEAYRPARYAGKVVFLQPENTTNLEPQAPSQVWRKYLSDLEARRVPGSHLGIVEDDATATAAEIGNYLVAAGFATT